MVCSLKIQCIVGGNVWRQECRAGHIVSTVRREGEREREEMPVVNSSLFIQTMMSTSEMAQPVYWVVFPSQLTLF